MARCASGDFWSSRATGVPHIADDFRRFECWKPSVGIPPDPSFACGVGQEPEPLPLVGCANGGRGEQTPFRIEPEVGKVGADVRKPSG
jgi:hypothetical protein